MNKLSGEDYTGIVTVFSLLLIVEYSSEGYDVWDLLIGILCLKIGFKFVKDAVVKNDFLYSWITSGLISLGIISILSSIYGFFTFQDIIGFGQITTYLMELIRFGIFIILSIPIFLWIKKKHSN